MPANLNDPFAPSCCEGGVCNTTHESARPCGCDPGANHICAEHQAELAKDILWQFTEPVMRKDGYLGIDRTPIVTLRENLYPEKGPTRTTMLPSDPKERKQYPIATGVLDYFPDAIVALSHVSWQGNEQHNPGEPLHWARGKSMDQDDTLIRHFMERGKFDKDGIRHSAKMAWRALAFLQLEIEAEREGK